MKYGRLLTKDQDLSGAVGSTRLECSEFTNPSEQRYLEEDGIVATSIRRDLVIDTCLFIHFLFLNQDFL